MGQYCEQSCEAEVVIISAIELQGRPEYGCGSPDRYNQPLRKSFGHTGQINLDLEYINCNVEMLFWRFVS